jgi:uncharacterized membrane protein YkvA (DUF1232 family)
MKADDPKPQRSSKYRAEMRRLVRQTRAMTLLLRHPAVPWHAKVVAACSVGYLLSPIQLIPTFIPAIGQLDDLAVLYVGMKVVRVLTPPTLLEECEAHAATAAFFASPRRMSQTEYTRSAAV